MNAAWTAFDVGRRAQHKSYAAPTPRNIAVKKALAAIPKDSVIYSNLPDVVYFIADALFVSFP